MHRRSARDCRGGGGGEYSHHPVLLRGGDLLVGCVAKNVSGSAVRNILEDLGCWEDEVDGDKDDEVDEDGADIGIGVG